MLCLRLLVTSLLLWRPAFGPGQFCVRLVVYTVMTLGQAFFEFFGSLLSLSLYQCSELVLHSLSIIVLAVYSFVK
jgi:hypothetical protein